jgi:hypothetical protein
VLVCRVRARVRWRLISVGIDTTPVPVRPAGSPGIPQAADRPQKGRIDAGGLGFGLTPKKSFEDVSNR